MTISNCAKIVQWNDEKGFGFAEANGARYFFHISALGLMSRRPKIGDTIIIENFGKSEKGLKIEKGSIKGVTVSSNQALFYCF